MRALLNQFLQGLSAELVQKYFVSFFVSCSHYVLGFATSMPRKRKQRKASTRTAASNVSSSSDSDDEVELAVNNHDDDEEFGISVCTFTDFASACCRRIATYLFKRLEELMIFLSSFSQIPHAVKAIVDNVLNKSGMDAYTKLLRSGRKTYILGEEAENIAYGVARELYPAESTEKGSVENFVGQESKGVEEQGDHF